MNSTLKVFALILALSSAAGAQVAPAATSAGSLPLSNRLYYAFRYSQTAVKGGAIGTWQTSNLSGTADYANASVRAPFVMEYSGGYTWTIQGPSYGSGLFQRMFISQSGVWRKWLLTVSDDASYLPQAPTTGFSGIAGIGDPIGTPSPTPVSSQSILTLNTHVVHNMATGSLENKLTAATSFSGQGNYELLRFPNGDGLDTDTYAVTGQVTHRLDGRDSVFGSYQYSRYSYPQYALTFETQTGPVGFRRLLSRKLSTSIAAGPMWITSSNQTVVPSKLTYMLNGKVEYSSKPTMISAGYNHAANGGAGYLLGATWDSVDGNMTRSFGPNFQLGLTGGYDHTAGMSGNGSAKGVVGGTQATWQISRNFIAFANYTGIHQTTTGSLPANVLDQTLHTVGFGVGYSPRNNHFKQ